MVSKGMVGLAALIATVFVTIDSAVVTSASETDVRLAVVPQSDAATTADFKGLGDQARSALTMLLEREQDKAQERAKAEAAARPVCPDQTWPYYTANCLVAGNGAAGRPIRVVGVEGRSDMLQPVSF